MNLEENIFFGLFVGLFVIWGFIVTRYLFHVIPLWVSGIFFSLGWCLPWVITLLYSKMREENRVIPIEKKKGTKQNKSNIQR